MIDKQKKIVLFVLIPIVIVLLYICIYLIISTFKATKTTEDTTNPFSQVNISTIEANNSVLPSKQEAYELKLQDSIIKEKIDTTINLNRYEEQKEAEERRQAEAEERKRELLAQMGIEEEKQPEHKTKPIQQPTRKQKSQSTRTTTIQHQDTQKPESTEETEEYGYYGFGKTIKPTTQKTIKASSPKADTYYEAFLIADTKMKDGSQVTFILNEDAEIGGIRFKKMSRIYGVCHFGTNVVNIESDAMQNTDGKKYTVYLTAYNENYQKGIYVSGIEKIVGEGQSEVAEDVITDLPVTKYDLVNTTAKTIARTTKKANRKDQEISMREGYKMYFKAIEEKE